MQLDRALSATLAGLAKQWIPSVVQVGSSGRGAGAGIVWGADGEILTNYHVVARARGLTVQMADGEQHEARLVASEPSLDLALLRVPASGLPAVTVGASGELRVGALVFAIGHPWGQRNVVTAGIVSGLGAMATSDGERAAIRSSVRLAPGNSGGPLLDARGHVVGINSMIFGGDLSIAIPSDAAAEWVSLEARPPARLGLQVQPVPLPPALFGDQPPARAAGLLVTAPPEGALLLGDVLVEVAGEAVEDERALRRALARGAAQERLPLRLLRGGALRSLEVERGALERPG